MRNPTLATVAVTALFTLVGLAGTALADKDDPVDPKVHKEDTKHQYINLGLIGDIGLFCGLLPGDVVLPGIRSENLCLGGAEGPYDPADSHSRWDFWIHDYIWNGCDTYTIPAQDGLCPVQPAMGLGVEGVAELALETATSTDWTVELKSAGLARTVTTYDLPDLEKGDPKASSACTPIPPNTDPESGPNVCVQEVGDHGATRNTNTVGFCGQGSIDAANGMIDPFDTSGGPNGDLATNVTVTKQVYTDGVLFYLLDCPLTAPYTDGDWVSRFVADLVNSQACPNPVLHIFLVCVYPLPTPPLTCFEEKVFSHPPNTLNLGVVALVGEIGWTHEETNTCKDMPIHDDWVYDAPSPSIVLKGVEP